MKKHYIKLLIWFVSTTAFSQVQGVGINEDNPQQALHLGSSTGTIRVDGLNSTNNAFNGGGVDKTCPLYVNSNGDFTLSVSPFQNSDGTDALTSTTPLASTSVIIPATGTGVNAPNDGTRTVQILPYTITVTRACVLEIKYGISYEVLASTGVNLKSDRARRITTFYTLDGDVNVGRRYGQSSKCYFNNDAASIAAAGNLFNSSTTYINLPAGETTIRFWGEVNCGDTNELTRVNFGVGADSVFMRLY